MQISQDAIISRETPPSCSARIASIGLLILLTFSVFTLRLWYLQLEEGSLFRVLSERNRLRLKWIPPMRGVIYDRAGRVVVDNRPSFDVVVVPEDAPDLQATLS